MPTSPTDFLTRTYSDGELRVGIANWAFLSVLNEHVAPELAYREAAVNSYQAGAKSIIFSPNDDGRVMIGDDGEGIPPDRMLGLLGQLGESSKPIGAEDNLGIGLIWVALCKNPTGLRITSRYKGEREAYQVWLHRRSVNPVQYEFKRIGKSGSPILKVPSPFRSESGTLVELLDTPFGARQLTKYLNSRFLDFGNIPKVGEVSAQVFESAGSERGLEPRRARGVLPSLQSICSKFGKVEYQSCTLHWGIRKDPKDPDEQVKSVLDHYFTPWPLYIAWRGEVMMPWSNRAATPRVLREWGIPCGEGRLIFVVVAKGRGIAPTPARDGIQGWVIEDAKSEIANNLPPEILQFIAETEEQEQDLMPGVQDLTRRYLKQIDCLFINKPIDVGPPVDEDEDVEDEDDEEEEEEEEEEDKPTKKRRKRRKRNKKRDLPQRTPDVVFVHPTTPSPFIGEYVPPPAVPGHVIKINLDHARIRRALPKTLHSSQKKDILARIATQAIGGFAGFVEDYGRTPDGDDFNRILMCCLAALLRRPKQD